MSCFTPEGHFDPKEKVRAWCWTLNNYIADDIEGLKDCGDQVTYQVFGFEVGEEGTPHLQGFTHFANAKNFKQVVNYFGCPRMHISPRYKKSTNHKAALYCKKDGNFFEVGTPPLPPGTRTDIQVAREMEKKGHSIYDIGQVCGYQATKHAELLRRYAPPPLLVFKKKIVHWYWGPPGAGKTRRAVDEAGPEAYLFHPGKWWPGYVGQPRVIMDDVRESNIDFSTMLRLLDGYPTYVESKGTLQSFHPDEIWITAPYAPNVVYSATAENIIQLLRRITDVSEIRDFVLDKDAIQTSLSQEAEHQGCPQGKTVCTEGDP